MGNAEKKKGQGESAMCSVGLADFEGPVGEPNELNKQNLDILLSLTLQERPEFNPEFLEVAICSNTLFPNSLQFHFYFSEIIFVYSKLFVLTPCFCVHWCVTSPTSANNLQKTFLKEENL